MADVVVADGAMIIPPPAPRPTLPPHPIPELAKNPPKRSSQLSRRPYSSTLLHTRDHKEEQTNKQGKGAKLQYNKKRNREK